MLSILTLQNAVAAPTSGSAIFCGSANTLKIVEISGTSTSRAIIFEISGSETGSYSPITGLCLTDQSTGTQANTLNQIWQFDNVAGLWFRARISAVAGGNVTIKAIILD